MYLSKLKRAFFLKKGRRSSFAYKLYPFFYLLLFSFRYYPLQPSLSNTLSQHLKPPFQPLEQTSQHLESPFQPLEQRTASVANNFFACRTELFCSHRTTFLFVLQEHSGHNPHLRDKAEGAASQEPAFLTKFITEIFL